MLVTAEEPHLGIEQKLLQVVDPLPSSIYSEPFGHLSPQNIQHISVLASGPLFQAGMESKRSRCFMHSSTCMCTEGPLKEQVLLLVFKSQNWNPILITSMAQVCRWFRDLAKRLWREFCVARGPKMVSDMRANGRGIALEEWNALAKVMLYCAGCHGSRNVRSKSVLGHFVQGSRFSKTSGGSFLLPECRSDVLYISDPCEHLDKNGKDDIGLFRGVFKSFLTSKTLRLLVDLSVKYEPKEICPYCYTSVWSLLSANMIPRSSHRRLGAEGDVEYFVCVNGHLHGRCSLSHLSDDDVSSEEE